MSRKNSAFLERMAENRRVAQEATRKTFMQYMTDTACVTLNEMGWGKERIDTFLTNWGNVYDEFFDALRDTPETDYYRAKFDERVKAICKPEYYKPFEDRYEYLPEMRY